MPDSLASGAVRYLCPLRCGWHYDERPDARSPVTVTIDMDRPDAVQHGAQQIADARRRAQTEATERTLAEHIATHTPQQFVTTVEALRRELDAVDEALRDAGIEYPLGARGVRDLAGMLMLARDNNREG